MHTVKRVCTLVLTGLLALPMAAPAGAAAHCFHRPHCSNTQ